MALVVRCLAARLRLQVNAAKSAGADVEARQLLGDRLKHAGSLEMAPRSEPRAKQRLRAITRRKRGIGREQIIRGW